MRSTNQASFLAGGGELGALMREFDWSQTPLGPCGDWPQSLKTAVRVMLTSRQPIWVGWGEELIYLYNDPYKSIIGGKHPRALGRPTREVWSEIWPAIGPLLAKAMGGDEGTYVEDQLLIMERNGYPEETYYTFSYSPVHDDEGNPGGIICANTDETQRVIGERQITLLRDLSASTVGAANVPDACRRAAEALRTNNRDLPFALIYLATGGELRMGATAGIEAADVGASGVVAAGSATPWPLEEVLRTREIHVVAAGNISLPPGGWDVPPEKIALLPIAGAAETAEGVLVVGLSPYRLFDEGYRSFLGLAAGQVATAIANAAAYEAERQRAEALAEVDRAKTAFFSNVSHEFRTPLTLMLGPLEDSLAEGAGMPAPQRERLTIAHRNALRLQRLVNSLLDFSRIEAGRVRAVFRPTQIAAFTRDLASSFRAATDRAGLYLNVEADAIAAPVYIDRDMWEKIVLNLLSNAFKFTLEGGITVKLEQADERVRLVVADTGIGIPAPELPRLFERFHRVEGAVGRSYEGTGIGLALVQDLVRIHGGEIRVGSEPGVGSEFTVELPLGCAHLPPGQVNAEQSGDSSSRRAATFVEEALRWLPSGERNADQDDDVVHDMEASDATTATLVSPHRIVLADDNNDLRDYIAGLLRRRGHLVETVVDGAEALEVIRRLKPDLLVTDVMMPRMDGMALLRVIRSDASLQDLPVIVLSARAGEEARVAGLDAGADDYLAKPFSARELIARVDSNLALTRLRRHVTTALREETRMLEALNRTGTSLAGQLDLERVVQRVTDAGVELTGAQFGAFFYNVTNSTGDAYMLYTLSGVDRSAFDRFPMPRNTQVFAPTFSGDAIVRSDDITQDPRYGHNAPFRGMPEGHLPVCSYLAVPVRSRSGDVLGGLFFGHAQPGRFTDRHERLMSGVAGQAAVALDNSRLYRAAQREIEQRKAAERALQLLNEKLEDRVAEEIQVRREAETALQQAQKMEAIGQLTGGVAHDFNNLLQVISGNLQLLCRDLHGNERAEARLHNALEGVARGTRLASQLLAYGRRQPLEPKVINAGRFVRGLDDLLRRALGEEIEIETTVAAGLWNTFADPSQIENALLNLAINARDAMNGRGKLTIEVGNALIGDDYATHADVVPGQYVMLAVTDTGGGIPPDIIDRVFEPFFTTKSEGRGTGLGLSMVYGFVKQSGGHVKIYSEEGLGTTIKLYLPRSIAHEDMPVDSSPLASVGGSEIVLVVEDDAQVRATAVDLLSDLGYRVLQATDATSALAVVESGVPIDLLFTDVVMPGPLRSPELARRARERLPGIAVLFTSGYAEDAIVHGGRLDEGVSLLAKPYTREALSRKVRQVLVSQQQANVGRGLLPRSEVPMMPAPVPPPAEDGDPMRVLLVEDEEILRLVTVELLEEMGHVVHSAESAEEALALLAQQDVDVLITDVSLPGRSGFGLASEAGALQPGIGIVFASGGARLPPEWRSATMLLKPYKVKALEECLLKLGKRSARKP